MIEIHFLTDVGSPKVGKIGGYRSIFISLLDGKNKFPRWYELLPTATATAHYLNDSTILRNPSSYGVIRKSGKCC